MSKLVKAEAAMDDDTLIKHMNARHVPMAGLTEVRARGAGEKLLRQWHVHVHHRGYDDNDPERTVNHEHQADG